MDPQNIYSRRPSGDTIVVVRDGSKGGEAWMDLRPLRLTGAALATAAAALVPLKTGGKGTAKVTVTAADDAGNEASDKRKIKLK
ncbi:MAG: hypothetical protein ACR2N5_08220 [Solirubrobacterales bacterium]